MVTILTPSEERLTPGSDGVHQSLKDVNIVISQVLQAVNKSIVCEAPGQFKNLIIISVVCGDVGSTSQTCHATKLNRQCDDENYKLYRFTEAEKAVWNCVEKHPPEEKPLTDMVSREGLFSIFLFYFPEKTSLGLC